VGRRVKRGRGEEEEEERRGLLVGREDLAGLLEVVGVGGDGAGGGVDEGLCGLDEHHALAAAGRHRAAETAEAGKGWAGARAKEGRWPPLRRNTMQASSFGREMRTKPVHTPCVLASRIVRETLTRYT
jgi:hypothetical protein